jgi:hypothetical protein
MGSDYGGAVRRFTSGEAVWIEPAGSGEWLVDDEAVILEDLGCGYLVLQATERVPSYGQGHYVCDTELSRLLEVPPVRAQQEVPVVRDFQLMDFTVRVTQYLNRACGYRNTDTGSMRILTHA